MATGSHFGMKSLAQHSMRICERNQHIYRENEQNMSDANTIEIAVKERPILFSGKMVQAILDGRKTQTRRTVKPKPDGEFIGPKVFSPSVTNRRGDMRPGPEQFGIFDTCGEWSIKCPYGCPGDRLWVRETHCKYGSEYIYRADYGDLTPISDGIGGPWVPSIHMPRQASRISL